MNCTAALGFIGPVALRSGGTFNLNANAVPNHSPAVQFLVSVLESGHSLPILPTNNMGEGAIRSQRVETGEYPRIVGYVKHENLSQRKSTLPEPTRLS